AAASAMGLRDLPQPVAGDWLADPAHWRQLHAQLTQVVAAHAERDALSAGLSVDAARAQLGLPDRGLVEALATWRPGASPAGGSPAGLVQLRGGYLQPADGPGSGPNPGLAGLPAQVAAAVQAVLADLAEAPFSAPDRERLRELGLDPKAAAAAERAGLLCRLPGDVVLPADAAMRATGILAGLPQPFTASQARQALGSSRRVVIPLLEWLDREGVTRRHPDDSRTIRDQPRPVQSGG
ncbi:MAG: SelB C-terminal domain-containing protein, partial [Actinobacteria bacterium]|nr:SelB C-terminal domain-containing protein [Actinomycetota bacterium]